MPDDADFFIPPRRLIRSEYTATRTPARGAGGAGVEQVWRARFADGERELVAEYELEHSMSALFEPFRQLRDGAWYDYALIAPHHDGTSVLDLSTGLVVAEEDSRAPGAAPAGFCPVQFHVPDFWDRNKAPQIDRAVDRGAQIPGDSRGLWGLLAGCHWGDDSSWKVQHLDLSGVHEGRLVRDDRFGYVELASGVSLADAAGVHFGGARVDLAVTLTFALSDGAAAAQGLSDPTWRTFVRDGERDQDGQ